MSVRVVQAKQSYCDGLKEAEARVEVETAGQTEMQKENNALEVLHNVCKCVCKIFVQFALVQQMSCSFNRLMTKEEMLLKMSTKIIP